MSSQKVHYDACPLGHAKLETTALYTRVAVNTVRDIKSPLERLGVNLDEAERRPPDRGRMARPCLEVADVFRAHGAAWRKANAGHVEPRPAEGHVGDRDLPDRRARRTCRALRGLRARTRSPTTPAATATARSVRARRRGNGSPNARPSFCRFPTITSSSPCRLRSARSRSRTRPPSTTSCSGPPPRR